jgi:hemolysin activation/secretion protein
VEPITYRGRNTSAEVSIERVVHRDQASKTAVELALGKRWAKTYLNDVEIEVQRRDVTTATLSVSHRHGIGPATLDVTLGVRRGLPWLAQDDPADDGGPTTEYTLGTIEVSLSLPLRPFGLPLRFQNRWRGQYTPDRVLVSDQFSIGGRYTVRGFDGEQTLTAESGWYTRNELAYGIPRIGQEVYAGIDHGQVSGPSAADLVWKGLTGSVIGLRGGYRFISYDAFVGFPLVRPTGFQSGRPALGFMVTAQY